MTVTTGSGFYLSRDEKDHTKQNVAIQQLMEGRSNAVGVFTVTSNGTTTSTGVTAATCGPNSIVMIEPYTLSARNAGSTTYVLRTNVAPGAFTVTHAATTVTDVSFWFACLG